MIKYGKATIALILVLACSATLGSVSLQQVKALYQGDITISTFGVNPASAPIQQAGTTYTLTSDVEGAISVKKNDIILDGNGNTLAGALRLDSVTNVTAKNFNINGGKQFGAMPGGVFTGVYLSGTSNSVIVDNTITGISNIVAVLVNYETVAGIIVASGASNTFSGNNLVDNWQGMIFSNTERNLIVENNFTLPYSKYSGYADAGGIYFDQSSNNTIYHNNFNIGLGAPAKDSYYNSTNTWDNGYPSGGNYWSDYKSTYRNAAEIDTSGIGNTSYVVDEMNANAVNNTDRYPLMNPFNSTFRALQLTPPKITITSPLNQTYNDTNVPLTFSIEVMSPVKSVNWTGYTLDSQPNATITSNSQITNITLNNLTTGMHSITVYANDTYGNVGSSKTVTFTIAKSESENFLPIIVAAVLVASVLIVGSVIYFKKRRH